MVAAFKKQQCSSHCEVCDDSEEEEEQNEVETPEEEDDNLPVDIQEYEDQDKTQHDIAFCCYKRNSCFAHTLQLVIRTFTNVHKLVSKVNKSAKATESLIKKSGVKLISDCPTLAT